VPGETYYNRSFSSSARGGWPGRQPAILIGSTALTTWPGHSGHQIETDPSLLRSDTTVKTPPSIGTNGLLC
jgi:hypothetical protein